VPIPVNNKLILKRVAELFKYNFFIPAYQRGYRWNSSQVKQLLNDLWDFSEKDNYGTKENSPFYCLQPVVVKIDDENNRVEVIDGQQRLTTIYLILKHLEGQIDSDTKNFASISYETRIKTSSCVGSEEFLKNIKDYQDHQDKADANIDFSHMLKAYNTIEEWFKKKANNDGYITAKAKLAPILIGESKVIWYEVQDSEFDEKRNNLIDIFTRLNTGKIPLTNAELIRALFLQKDNFSLENATLNQLKIAFEWDIIEKKLQNDSFWYFIYSTNFYKKYETRIEYIFDIIQGRQKGSEYYYTFNKYLKDFTSTKENANNDDTNITDYSEPIDIWRKIKKYFLKIEEWYNDYELFHYVGFLIEYGTEIDKLINESNDMKKNEFLDYLKKAIENIIPNNIEELSYDNKNKENIKKILLLFNIQTVLESQKSDMRFPFHKYKSESWDIEHVCSQTDKLISERDRPIWVSDNLEYFTGSTDSDEVTKYVDSLNEKLKEQSKEDQSLEICKKLIELNKLEIIKDKEFTDVFDLVENFFKGNNPVEDKDSISNLTLLDSITNRSYGNAFFPIKRKRIIDNDSKGIFVPIATKNLFLKYYSKKFDEIKFWNEEDAKNYLDAMKHTLHEFSKDEVVNE
jgi:uncharacterized protein with ParB-like and HNH nuclease domain